MNELITNRKRGKGQDVERLDTYHFSCLADYMSIFLSIY